jgi:hypothetical protein
MIALNFWQAVKHGHFEMLGCQSIKQTPGLFLIVLRCQWPQSSQVL